MILQRINIHLIPQIALIVAAGFFAPIVALAQPNQTIFHIIIRIHAVINAVIPLLIGFAILFTIYSIVRYVIAGNENEKRKGAVSTLWSIIAIVIILSIWWLVGIVAGTFQVKLGGDLVPGAIPGVPIP